MSKAFARAFIQDRLLTDSQVGQLVGFMVSHADQLWVVPEDVQLAVDMRLGKAVATASEGKWLLLALTASISSSLSAANLGGVI